MTARLAGIVLYGTGVGVVGYALSVVLACILGRAL
jgi:hypothetical protein